MTSIATATCLLPDRLFVGHAVAPLHGKALAGTAGTTITSGQQPGPRRCRHSSSH